MAEQAQAKTQNPPLQNPSNSGVFDLAVENYCSITPGSTKDELRADAAKRKEAPPKPPDLPSPTERRVELTQPPTITASGSITYEMLDAFSRAQCGESLYDYTNQRGSLGDDLPNEEAFRDAYHRAITLVDVGTYPGAVGMFSVFAEEGNLSRGQSGELQVPAFAGMNTPHAAVAAMFDELLRGVTIGTDGTLHGKGTIELDLGNEQKAVRVEVDFDRGTITPPLYAHGREMKFEELRSFIGIYLNPDEHGEPLLRRENGRFRVNPARAEEDAMNIFFPQSASAEHIRHEIQHALYDGEREVRDDILEQVRGSDRKQREAAIMFLCTDYDVFDPDTPAVSRDLVIDEAFNAYADQGVYNPMSTALEFGGRIPQIVRQFGLDVDLARYGSIDALPIDDKFKASLHNLKDKLMPHMSEEEFLRSEQPIILGFWKNLGDFRQVLIDQSDRPGNARFLAQLAQAREALVDWVDSPASR